jgi:uncharacterized protein (TIGR03437 family)
VTVSTAGVPGAPYFLTALRFLPAIYCNVAPGTSRFYVTAVSTAGEYLGTRTVDTRVARGVHPGETIDIYAVGLGPTTPAFPTGTLFTGFNPISSTLNVVLHGEALLPSFAALVSPGLYQVRFQVPADMPSGDQLIYLDFGAVQSPLGVYLTIQP